MKLYKEIILHESCINLDPKGYKSICDIQIERPYPLQPRYIVCIDIVLFVYKRKCVHNRYRNRKYRLELLHK